MSCASPVFIFQNRFGTYYFRCRIPKHIKNNYQTTKTEVRRSLATKDYRQAINSARRLWVTMIDNDFFLSGDVKFTTGEGRCIEIGSNPEPAVIQFENPKKQSNVNLLSDVVDKFCDENRLRWSATYEDKEFRPIISLLTEVIGNKSCSLIDSQDIVKFKEIYSQLPKNRKKILRYRKKSVSELHKISIPAEDRLSIATIKKTFNILITFISWCSDNDYLSGDIAKPLQRFNKQNMRDTPEYEERDPFSNDDLKKIFESREYRSGSHKKPSEQWIPLIALYSGCRLRECYQLSKNDIKKDLESGVHYFDITPDRDNGKTLKTKSSKRKIPIHQQLIQLGFLEYVESVPDGKPIFSEIQSGNIEQLTRYFSKWFGRYRKKCGVGVEKNDKKTFHSFRHLVCNNLKSKEVNIDVIEEIAGHSNKNSSETRNRYTLPYELSIKYKAISLLDFNLIIDFKKIILKKYFCH